MKRYFALNVSEKDRVANIDIYGDITSWEWHESDVSSYTLSKALEELDVDKINVFINSYGGEYAEGLAIYNKLKRHKAEVTTYCDGLACSAASVVFMSGDTRVMATASLLMIHRVWTGLYGNANELRKEANNLESMDKQAVKAYMEGVTIDEEKLETMLDEETWIGSDEAVTMGFATKVESRTGNGKPSQYAREAVAERLLKQSIEEPKVVGTFNVECKEFSDAVGKLAELLGKNLQEDNSCEDKTKENKIINMFKGILLEEVKEK